MSAVFAQLCPICLVTWTFQRGGQHVTCIRDRHIVEAHSGHAMALVVVARRDIGRAEEDPGPNHPLDEPCPEAPGSMDVSVDAGEVLADWAPGPFDLYPVEEHGMDELDLDMTDEEWTLLKLVGAGWDLAVDYPQEEGP